MIKFAHLREKLERGKTIVSAPVLAGAYLKSHKAKYLVHAVELKDGEPHRALCGKVKPEHITDDTTEHNKHAVTCPTCLKRYKPE